MITRKKNVDEMCRLCAGETKNGVVIYDPEGLELCLEKKIVQCLKIEISKADRLPKKICYSCQSRLEESHRFLEETKRVQKTWELLVEINDINTQLHNEPKILKNVELGDEFDLKGEIKGLPLDVVIEEENRKKIRSLKLSRCANYVTDKEALELHEMKRTDRFVEKNSLKFLQHTNTASTLPLKSDEGEISDEGYEVTKIRSIVPCSVTNRESQNINAAGRENFSETEEEEDSDKNAKEWKKQWGIKCIKCDTTFPYRSQFDKHYKNDHNKDPIYTCSYCNKTVEKYSTFRSHCYRHVNEGRYRCEQCEKSFGLRGALHVHVLAKHSGTQKTFMCEQCGKSFATRAGLNTHLLTHHSHELSPQEFPCADCGKVLRTRGGLAAHMLAHRVGRRFLCDYCGCSFTQKANLQQHQRLRHSGDRPFACPEPSCSKRFAEKSHLNRHCSFHSEKRPFQCTVCLKMYKTERCLKVHAMVHSEVRPYVCSYCNKGFLNSTRLKQHVNIHTGERPFACHYCERKFTNYPNWLKHNRRRHKDSNPKRSPALGVLSSPDQGQDAAPKGEEKCFKLRNASLVDAIIENPSKAQLQYLSQTQSPHQEIQQPAVEHTSFPLPQHYTHELISEHISQTHVLL